MLAAGMAVLAIGVGITFSLAVFLEPLEDEFAWSRSLISGIALVNWVIFGICAFARGALSAFVPAGVAEGVPGWRPAKLAVCVGFPVDSLPPPML